MIHPPYLQPGDAIGLVAPARKLDGESISAAKELLERWGFVVKLGENLLTNHHPYLSAQDDERIRDFQGMINDDSIKAIICVRGGYGTTRILDQLDFLRLQQNPKWIVGFSDITSLHLHLYSLGIESIHATMPVLFTKPEQKESVADLLHLLQGELKPIMAAYHPLNKLGETTGEIIGGNLSLLADALGTASQPVTNDRILVIEEVDEYAYKVDRMLVQLKRANILPSLAGLVIGHFTDIKESSLPFGESIKEIVVHHTKEYKYPVAFNFPIGHEAPNLPFIHGAKGRLIVKANGSEITYMNEAMSA